MKDNEYTLMIHLYFEIEEFDNMDVEDIKDELHPINPYDWNSQPSISELKYMVLMKKETILKESMVFL